MIKEFDFANHEEWLAIRSKYIGGSDAAAVIGLNPYKSRYTLWAEKTGQIEGFEGNLTTKVGAYLEEFVAKLFEEETGKKVRRKNRTMVNDLYPFACANIDRAIVGEKALLEIKTTNSFPIMKQCKGTEFPEAYYCQVVHYLAVTGLEKAYLGVLINCRDFKIFELERDEEEINALMEAEKNFWNLVENKVPPIVDGTESTTDTISALYPTSTNEEGSVDLYFVQNQLDIYHDLSRHIEELTNLKNEKANIIKEFMKDAGHGECEMYKVSYTSYEKKTFDAKKFASEHKDIDLSGYYKTSNVRTFKVTKKGE